MMNSYNERLFSRRIISKLHYARFHWLKKSLEKLNCKQESVLELGCFDGKAINFLPKVPRKYIGFDANVEGGLDIAIKQWKDFDNYQFIYCMNPVQMELNGKLDIGIAMETLEHIPDNMLDAYLKKLAIHVNECVFITVPNEKKLMFFSKWLIKKLTFRSGEKYTVYEFINASLGRMHKIKHKDHKGFDYHALIEKIKENFEIFDIQGIPFSFLPLCLSFQIGIIAVPRE
jgi:cyclopropane fatty-acyl-phospholipid synthase-like methyltransferase